MRDVLYVALIATFMLFLTLGCSNGIGGAVVPESTPDSHQQAASASEDAALWGMWDFYFDPAELKVEVVPVRDAAAHFDVTTMILPPNCDNCLVLAVNSFNPGTGIMDIDVSLRNPEALAGRDVRGILYTNAAGHLLMNPDDWTPIFDIAGGMTINPFRSFAKSETNRIFAPHAVHTENYQVYIPTPPQYWAIRYAATAFWPGNCKEPYMIDDFQQLDEIPAYTGSSGTVQVYVYDWQSNIDYVRLYATEINGLEYIEMTNTSGNIWQADVVNYEGAPAGEYEVKIEAHSEGTADIALYDFATVTLSELPPAQGWARNYGGGNADIAFDANQNIYVTGQAWGTADFDPGPGVAEYVSKGDADCCIIKFDQYGNFQWGVGWGGADRDSCTSVDVDPSGNVYLTGYFKQTVDFDPTGTVEEYSTPQDYGAFLCKYDSDGNYLWTKVWGNNGNPEVRAAGQHVAVSGTSAIYVTGYYEGTVDFDPGPGTESYTSIQYGNDLFLSKFNADGELQWAFGLGAGTIIPDDMKADASGNVYIAGYYASNSVDFDPGPGSDVHVAEWHQSSFLAKYTPDGELGFARTWGLSNNHDQAKGVCVDDAGHIYVTGYFEGTIDIDPGAGIYEVTVIGGQDVYLLKLSSTGLFQWVLTWGSEGSDYGYSVENYGNSAVYVTGGFWHGMDFDPDPVDEDIKPVGWNIGMIGFLSKFDSTGDYQWGQYWGGGVYYSSNAMNQARVWQGTGDVFITGYIAGAVDFDPGPTEDIHNPSNGGGAILAKFTEDGTW